MYVYSPKRTLPSEGTQNIFFFFCFKLKLYKISIGCATGGRYLQLNVNLDSGHTTTVGLTELCFFQEEHSPPSN